jgi:serine/threonine protein kinase
LKRPGDFILERYLQGRFECLCRKGTSMRTSSNQPLQAGQALGHYQLIRPLDQRPATEVWQALHIDLQVNLALKIIPRNLPVEEYLRYEQRLREEARILASLHHPHIVGYRDYLRGRDFYALVLQYAPGGSVARHYYPGRKLPLSLIRFYTWQIANALQAVHERGLVHRDVKPGNILLLGPHYALLTDFGLAMYAATGYPRKLYTGGTAPYMAPEQFRGQPCPASDQYSLAICVYEWLTGHRPFASDAARTQRRRRHQDLVSVRAYRPELSDTVNEILRIALHPDPELRYPTVLDFARQFVGITRTARPPLVKRMLYDRGRPVTQRVALLPSTLPFASIVDMPALSLS